MKKAIGIILVILTLYACRKSQPAAEPQPLLRAADCISLEGYDQLSTNKEKAAWLVNNGKLVCDSILYPRETIHEVPAADVSIPESAKPFVAKWSEIQTIIGDTIYEKYLGFKQDELKNVVAIELVPEYLEEGNTYSAPLFRSIALKYDFEETTELEFVQATVKKAETIVIHFRNKEGKSIYYDMTGVPL